MLSMDWSIRFQYSSPELGGRYRPHSKSLWDWSLISVHIYLRVIVDQKVFTVKFVGYGKLLVFL